MNIRLSGLIICVSWIVSAGAEPTLSYDFNQFSDGPIDGQFEWNVYDKVKDSSALSIMDQLGTIEMVGDKALVVRASKVPIRCVTGEPVRWLPGRTLTVEFDFKVAIDPVELSTVKPVMTLLVGNSLLSSKASWGLHLEATPDGDWRLSGAMSDVASKKIYAENFLIRSEKDVSISEWHKLVLVVKKLSMPDSFETTAELRNAKSGEVLAELEFTDKKKDKVAKTMWNTTRAHAGFYAPKNQLGIVCIDNLKVSSAE
jgi:hypothetical protein